LRSYGLSGLPSGSCLGFLETEVEQGLIKPWHYIGNYVADKLAEDAAEAATVPSHMRDTFQFCQRRAYKVRLRLIAAHRLYFNGLRSSSKKRKAGEALEGQPKRTSKSNLDENLESAVQNSSHHIIRSSVKKWMCSKCHSWGDPRYNTILGWLQEDCVPRKPPWLHESHNYKFSSPWHLCTKCGAHWDMRAKSGVHKLKGECTRPYQTKWLRANGF